MSQVLAVLLETERKSIHSATAEEAEPHLNKLFVHEPTGSHAQIESAGYTSHDLHPDAVTRKLGTLPSGKNIYSDPGRRQVRIKWVETPEHSRLKGGGHAVMKQVTDHLDKHSLPAILSTSKELHPFYAAHGFVPESGSLFGMKREPK